MNILALITIGISLSIDAFTLSLAYGLLNIPRKRIALVSIVVGIFHFFMPILGFNLGKLITKYVNINSKVVLIIILSLILIEMIKSINEEAKEYDLNIFNIILFAFLVSIDSFSLGIGINYITNNILVSSTIFSILSALFTFMGFILGKYFSIKAKKKAKYTGIFILFTVIFYFLCKH